MGTDSIFPAGRDRDCRKRTAAFTIAGVMSRTHRLFDLLQMLRQRHQPVSGAELAREAGISLRTLYRDIATLQTMGAEIDESGALRLGQSSFCEYLAPACVHLLFTA